MERVGTTDTTDRRERRLTHLATVGADSRPGRDRRGLASRIITGLLLAAGMGVLTIGVAMRLAGLHVQTVLSDSMRPTFSAGDVVVTRPVEIGSIRVGDVIAFQPPDRSKPVIHRVTSVRDGVITTRGDANSVDDPWHARLAGQTAYALFAVVPAAGWLAELRQPFLLLAGLMAGLAVLFELGKRLRARTASQQRVGHPDRWVHPDSDHLG